jgi:hypothetical protein
MRKTLALVMSVAVVAIVAAALTLSGSHHHKGRPVSIVRTVVPAAAGQPPTPSAAFDAEGFLNALTRVARNLADQLIDALSPADRAALAADASDRIGAAVG